MSRKFSHTRENYDRIARDAVLAKREKKIKCELCGQFYKKPCSHIVQRHGITAREYKETYGLDVSKGVVTDKLAKRFREMGKSNPSWPKNLIKIGAKYRFKKGKDPRRFYKRSKQTILRLKKYERRKKQ